MVIYEHIFSVEIHHPLQFLDLEKIRMVHSPSPHTKEPSTLKNTSEFSADMETEIDTDIETDTNKLGKVSSSFPAENY